MMKDIDVYIRRLKTTPSTVELCMTDNTIRRYPMKNIHEYVNQKPSSVTGLEKFKIVLDRDCWFAGKGRNPTLRILAEEYTRIIKTDLNCPVTVLTGSFIPDGASTPNAGWALIDGTHRLVKCLLRGRSTVRVVELTVEELQLHVAEIDRQ